MKFGESLSEGLVPEWENQYVDYKTGKKLIKKYTLLQLEFERGNVVDTTPLLEPISEVEQPDYFILNHKKHGQESQGTPQTPREDGLGSLGRRLLIFQFSTFRQRSLRKEDVAEEGAKFLQWLEDELTMVNNFYKSKERDVYHRFLILEDQFAQLKEQKIELLRGVKLNSTSHVAKDTAGIVNSKLSRFASKILLDRIWKHELPSLPSMTFLDNFRSKDNSQSGDVVLRSASKKEGFDPNYQENRIRNGESFNDSEVESDSADSFDKSAPSSTQMAASTSEQFRMSRKRDFVANKLFEVPYYYAKKVLKDALIEHYRSVALVRSYRTMNRTALRKITKKFDKASGSSISASFMKKVDNSYFQTSSVLEQILSRVEDLYLSVYGTQSDTKKHGLEKLKSATLAMQPRLYHGATFVSGIFLGFSVPLVALVIYIFIDKYHFKHMVNQKYLGQLWAGFLMMNLAMILVGINFFTYTEFKINYKFIFEFNLANALDYRQFLVLPSALFGFLGFCAWFSWLNFWPDKFPGKDWPLVFLAVFLIGFLWPGNQLYPASRKWLQIALWRILWSGFYPVEFRDFYLGDILCSLTYSLSNLPYFICLYGIKWRHYLGLDVIPDSTKYCGSGYSRSMGFFSALPSIWRFLQCLRRYMDTGDLFPHLANMTKYLAGCLYYCFLSLWRIHNTDYYRALFITFASVNSTFTTAWDIIMDWSLLQPGSKHFLLRDELFYERPIYYYFAMLNDVCLRFAWVVYIAIPGQLQQLALTSFFLALAELFRRFIWMFFRVENEHRTNVTLFRASRESPLPYHMTRRVENAIDRLVDIRYKELDEPSEEVGSSTPSKVPAGKLSRRTSTYNQASAHQDLEAGAERPAVSNRSTFGAISAAFNKAHIKDFQRRKFSVAGIDSDEEEGMDDDIRPLKPSSSQ
ncbi:hypothetical protein PUMCH_000916 [Australozyma saopauloensis]|uniref:Uncharacterized protein n=1 Tax=Australozyma saopauloensis TaxID=291208 RepID=A0AAX4H5A3_9ASCO|nr:hypothetical protein PUMCH_000916 [[Candida] saopauloensis]